MSGEKYLIPMIPVKGIVVFPGMSVSFDIAREKSIFALSTAMNNDQKVFITSQTDLAEDDPDITQLNKMGSIAIVKNVLNQQNGFVHVTVEGIERAELLSIESIKPFFMVKVKECKSKSVEDSLHEVALMNMARDLFEQYINTLVSVPPGLIMEIEMQKDPGQFSDMIAYNFIEDYDRQQKLLSELVIGNRLENLITFMLEELDLISLRTEMSQKFKNTISDANRKVYLREQLSLIMKELGEGYDPIEESRELKKKIAKLKTTKENKEKLLKECDRLMQSSYESQEAGIIRSYLNFCLSLPWGKKVSDKIDLKKAQEILDKDHYGLKKVKERIVEMLAVRKLVSELKGQIICFVGPPGVGKTSIVKSIAQSIGRKYVRIALGGIKDESDIRGHRKTYIGAMPGRIISAMKQAGSSNPLILLDEIDKVCKDVMGDPTSALLEVLDSAQNSTFYDHYLDLPFDLSDVLFITTANDYEKIPLPLLDRMDVIHVEGYTREEKFEIATRHLILKQMKAHGLKSSDIKIPDDMLKRIIDGYTREAGVRELERKLSAVFRKVAKMIVSGEKKRVVLNDVVLEQMLGPQKYRHEDMENEDEVGVTKGLAWTAAGGEAMPVEVVLLKGNGKIHLTGSLGNVMKESADIAISCIRSQCSRFGLNGSFYKKKDIHIHVPEGSVPKDGPSAGVTLATSVMSALIGLPVRRDFAMTGEITLRGKVLPIGGLKEKSMAAYVAGIKNVIIPKENEPDLDEVDEKIKNSLQFISVNHVDQVFEHAIVGWNKFKNEAVSKTEESANEQA